MKLDSARVPEPRRFTRRGLIFSTAAILASSAYAETPEVCETEDNQEGPFYKPGAPLRSNLREHDTAGVPLTLTGRVLGAGGIPLAGALLDVWQANGKGEYDNKGFNLRGRLKTDDNGFYRLETIMPKFYKAGDTIRPAHIHIKVQGKGTNLLTTQLYFKGDPYNYTDASVRPSLILMPKDLDRGKAAAFDFVLRKG
ncbi:MAG: dioxygenase [Bryobacteraceae bacterium]